MDTPTHPSPHPPEVDVIVVGSGAAAMSAAITAHLEGLSVLMLEKTAHIGGSTAISGGAIWIPFNDQTEKVGHPDSEAKVWEYLHNVLGEIPNRPQMQAYLDRGAQALRYLEQHDALRLLGRVYSPDYYPDRSGASMGGRALDPAEFDARELGGKFRELRNPLPEFTVLGGMMITLTDARHLLRVTRSFASWKHGMKLVLRYIKDRLQGYHRGTRTLLGNALAARLFARMVSLGVPYRLHAEVTALLRADPQAPERVTGVEVQTPAGTEQLSARKGVLLATGGFPWDAEMRQAHYPSPTGPYSMSPTGNTGDGIRMGREVGGVLGTGNSSPAFWAPVSVLQRADGTALRYPHLVWDRAKPGLIAVNSAGKRFVNESTSYHEFVIGMYRSHEQVATIPAYLLCDSDFIETWGLGLALPGGRPRQHLEHAGYLVKAPTLDALAGQLGMDGNVLKETVARYNLHAAQGQDPEFGKGSTAYNQYLGDPDHQPNACLAPLQKGPFYAVRVYPGDIGTALGLQADAHARALNAQGAPIPGLYVAGNDQNSVMGGAYPGPGITLGPALTFGWIAAMHMAHPEAAH